MCRNRRLSHLVPEHGAVIELVAPGTEEAGDPAVQQEREHAGDPQPLREQVPGQHAGPRGEGQVADRLERSAQIAAVHQAAQHGRLDGASIPPDPQGAANVGERRMYAGHREILLTECRRYARSGPGCQCDLIASRSQSQGNKLITMTEREPWHATLTSRLPPRPPPLFLSLLTPIDVLKLMNDSAMNDGDSLIAKSQISRATVCSLILTQTLLSW